MSCKAISQEHTRYANRGEMHIQDAKEGVLKCKKCYKSIIADALLQRGRKKRGHAVGERAFIFGAKGTRFRLWSPPFLFFVGIL